MTDLCENPKCPYNREGERHRVEDHNKLQSATALSRVSEQRPEDYLYALTKGGLSSVPIAGGIISAIFSTTVTSPYNKRMLAYLMTINERLDTLEKNGIINKQALLNDEEFMNVIIQSAEIAVKNSQKEKLDALRNCVINTARKTNIELDRKMIYLNIINQITPTHIIIFRTIANPEGAIRKLISQNLDQGKKDVSISLMKDFSNYLGIDEELFNVAIRDLDTWGLVKDTASTYASGLPEDKIEEVITNLVSTTEGRITLHGWEFLKFISEPEEK